MTIRDFEKDTIKVVWIEDDPGKIYSRMFDNETEAEAFAKDKKDYLIFTLITQKNMEDFSWELLPYGRHKIYRTLFRLYRGRMALFKRLIDMSGK